MYGMGGGGGTTAGSQGGGSAASGSVDQARAMDMSNIMAAAQLALVEAQKNKTLAEGRLADEKADAVGGYEKAESEARAGASTAQARKSNADAVLGELEGNAKREYEDKYIQGLVAEWEKSGQERDLNEIAIGLKRNGMHTPYIATVIGVLSGWDMTEKGALDQKVGLIPGPVQATLAKYGVKIDPQISRRQAMNMVIGLVATGKIGMDVFKTIFSPVRETISTLIKPN